MTEVMEASYRSGEEDVMDRRMEEEQFRGEISRERSASRERGGSPARRKRSASPARREKGGDVKRDNPEPLRILGVFGLNPHTSEKTLKELYSQYGEVEQCSIVLDRESGRSRGFGFVYFDGIESAQRAKEATNGMDLDDRKIRVDFSMTKRPHSPTPGKYMGRPRSSRDRHDGRRGGDIRRDRGGYYRERSPRRGGGGGSRDYYHDRGDYRSDHRGDYRNDYRSEYRDRERDRDRDHSYRRRSRSRTPPMSSRRRYSRSPA